LILIRPLLHFSMVSAKRMAPVPSPGKFGGQVVTSFQRNSALAAGPLPPAAGPGAAPEQAAVVAAAAATAALPMNWRRFMPRASMLSL
jgi:hypothetical protein